MTGQLRLAPTRSTTPLGNNSSRRRRITEVIAFVAAWVAVGYLLPVSSNGYLLLGIPLTIAFQVLVRRRPLRELFAAGTARFSLDRSGIVLAVALAVVPVVFGVRAVSGGDWAGAGWYVAATIGAACAAFAIRQGSFRSALRAAVLPIAVGATGFAAVYSTLHVSTGTPISAGAVLMTVLQYTALYFPAAFLLEEVSFRGALDAHVHHAGERHGLASAVFVSALWGLWHLPVSSGLSLPVPQLAGILVVVHVLLGVPLSLAWRRTRNLAGPAFAHGFNDAVRNAFMAGL
jgi:membrane protease YdiL (CAAX protease family)